HRRRLCRAKNLIESSGDLIQASFFSATEVSTRVHYQERDSQIRREANFLNQRCDGFIPVWARGSAKIHQISCVAKDATEAVCREFVCVACGVGGRKWLSVPLHVVFHENLDDLTADAAAAFEGFPNATAGGHMGAEFHGIKRKT